MMSRLERIKKSAIGELKKNLIMKKQTKGVSYFTMPLLNLLPTLVHQAFKRSDKKGRVKA